MTRGKHSAGTQSPWRGIRPWTRHSLVLLVAGLVYTAIGFAYFFAPMEGRRSASLVVALNWMPIQGWASLFISAGILAVISSRWPPIADTWGYTVLTGLSAGWATVYAMGVIFEQSPTANLSAAFLWGLVAFMWWAISGLVNPDRVVVMLDGSC